MQRISTLLGYLIGGVLLLAGLFSLATDTLPAILLIALGTLLLPPVTRWLRAVTSGRFTTPVKAGVAVLLFISFAAVVPDPAEEGRIQAAARQDSLRVEQETIFATQRDSVLTAIEVSIAEGDFDQAVRFSSEFSLVEDPALVQLAEQARSSLAEQRSKAREDSLLRVVRSIPASQLEQNRNVYQQLVRLNPENERYKEQAEHYSDAIRERARATAEANRQRARRAAVKWDVSTSSDPMTGQRSAYAHSRRTSSTERMGFPYHNVEAWVGFGCDGDSEWAYVGFSEAPNLTQTDTRDGYDRIRTRVRWDNVVTTTAFTQQWGTKFLHFENDADAIRRIISSGRVRIELPWYGEGRSHFDLSLAGSSDGIADARARCRGF